MLALFDPTARLSALMPQLAILKVTPLIVEKPSELPELAHFKPEQRIVVRPFLLPHTTRIVMVCAVFDRCSFIPVT